MALISRVLERATNDWYINLINKEKKIIDLYLPLDWSNFRFYFIHGVSSASKYAQHHKLRFSRDVQEIKRCTACPTLRRSTWLIIEMIRVRETTETIILPYPNARAKRDRCIIQGHQMVLSVSRHECRAPKSQTEEIDLKRNGALCEQCGTRPLAECSCMREYARCVVHKPNNVVKSPCRRDA